MLACFEVNEILEMITMLQQQETVEGAEDYVSEVIKRLERAILESYE